MPCVHKCGVVDLLEGQRYMSSTEMDRDVGGGRASPVDRNNNNWCGTMVNGGRRGERTVGVGRASVRNKEPPPPPLQPTPRSYRWSVGRLVGPSVGRDRGLKVDVSRARARDRIEIDNRTIYIIVHVVARAEILSYTTGSLTGCRPVVYNTRFIITYEI